MYGLINLVQRALDDSLINWKRVLEIGVHWKCLPILMLVGSNIFMTYAWYGHLKDFRHRPLGLVILIAWGVALLEYCLQVPANRIGIEHFSLSQLKVAQEIIALLVFAVFSVVYMKEPLKADLVWAGLCLVGAAYFVFRNVAPSP